MEMDSTPNGNNTATGTQIGATAAVNPTPAPSSNLPRLTESLKLEHQFLRVPFEHFKKTLRANNRVVEKEMTAVISGVNDAVSSDLSPSDAVNHLSSLVSRLQGLKRKVTTDLILCFEQVIPIYFWSFHTNHMFRSYGFGNYFNFGFAFVESWFAVPNKDLDISSRKIVQIIWCLVLF